MRQRHVRWIGSGRARGVLATLGLSALCACSSGEKSPAKATSSLQAGLHQTSTGWLLRTDSFTLEPNKERFLCYAVTTNEELSIQRFSSKAHRGIHHFLLSEATIHEAEGMSECDVLFKPTWAPMFAATTASASVPTPPGSAKIVEAGKQIVLQLHLLNTSSDPVTDSAEIEMERSTTPNPEHVGIFAFGTTDILIPPGKTTTIESTCTLKGDLRLYAMLPHMHTLGRRLELDVGSSENDLAPAFVRDPYSFDDQYIDPLDLTIKKGSVARVRCTYQNDRAESASFGESTFDEMCFGVGFSVGGDGLSGCVTGKPPPDGGVPRAPDAGVCGEAETSSGIGRLCTKGGNECAAGQFCTAGQGSGDAGSSQGICIQIGCTSNADCGDSRATCCTPPQGGGLVNICIPEACRQAQCIPVH